MKSKRVGYHSNWLNTTRLCHSSERLAERTGAISTQYDFIFSTPEFNIRFYILMVTKFFCKSNQFNQVNGYNTLSEGKKWIWSRYGSFMFHNWNIIIAKIVLIPIINDCFSIMSQKFIGYSPRVKFVEDSSSLFTVGAHL